MIGFVQILAACGLLVAENDSFKFSSNVKAGVTGTASHN